MHTMLNSLPKSGSKSSITSMSIIDKLPNFEIAIFWLSIDEIFCFLVFPTQMSIDYEESSPLCPVQFARVCCSFQLDASPGHPTVNSTFEETSNPPSIGAKC